MYLWALNTTTQRRDVDLQRDRPFHAASEAACVDLAGWRSPMPR